MANYRGLEKRAGLGERRSKVSVGGRQEGEWRRSWNVGMVAVQDVGITLIINECWLKNV